VSAPARSTQKPISEAEPVPTVKTGQAHAHPDPISRSGYSALELMPDDRTVVLLDQRLLPRQEKYEILSNVSQMADAIVRMQVRGAPALGIAAAYGLVLAAAAADDVDSAQFETVMRAADDRLRTTRPTAKNLAWALDRIMAEVPAIATLEPRRRLARVADLARDVHEAEVAACELLSQLGARLVPEGATILTYCNAGALATGGYGTALGVVRAAQAAGKNVKVIACETRPLLQGARLTAWELVRQAVPVEVITDAAAGALFAANAIDLVVVGADRIARNGDVANKVGTYTIACLAQMHGVPFDVAAPWSTVDLDCADGSRIPIERRPDAEVTHFGASAGLAEGETLLVAEGAKVQNPAFDVTPARLVRAIHTERGTIRPVDSAGIASLASR
jgi:methylthioribose-1-phosphate isomerase